MLSQAVNYTLSDYQTAVDRFIEDLRPLGSDVSGALLFGSLARGDVRPGKSDLLDAYLVLRSEVCLDRERFMRTLHVLVDTLANLLRTGLPVHPFFYCFEHERDYFHESHLMFYQSDATNRMLLGQDMKPRTEGRAESRAVARTSFFLVRQTAHQLGRYLHHEQLSDPERAEILHGLATVHKHLPRLTCLALDISANELKNLQELKEALPGLNMDVFERIARFHDKPAESHDLQGWHKIIVDTLSLIEHAHLMLLERLENVSQWPLCDGAAMSQ